MENDSKAAFDPRVESFLASRRPFSGKPILSRTICGHSLHDGNPDGKKKQKNGLVGYVIWGDFRNGVFFGGGDAVTG
jgi:hypothetical protein